MDFGERVRKRREELNMTQDELALKLGYKSRSSINKIEKDGRGIPQKLIIKLSKALDVPVSYIMDWDTDSDVDFELGRLSKKMTKDDIQFIVNYMKLNIDSKKKLLEYLEFIVQKKSD